MAKKHLPQFNSEAEEQAFWAEHDSTEYIDWSKARRAVLPNLRPSTKTISLRLPEHMMEELKLLARNSAVDLQGDTVVAITPVAGGRQTFAVYRCMPQ